MNLALIGSLIPAALASQRPLSPPARLMDVHVHIWGPVPATRSFADSLLFAFDAFHLEKAVLSGSVTSVIDVLPLAPNRLLGGVIYGAGLDLPLVTELRSLFLTKRLAVFGEIDAAWRGEGLDTAVLESYWELSEALSIPVAVFSGFAPPGTQSQPCCPRYRTRLARPGQLEEVIARHPKLRAYLMQAGWPYRDETIALLHAYPGVYADLGNLAGNPEIPRAEFYDYLHALMRAGLGKRLMFGSGLSIDEWPAKIGAIVAAIQDATFLTPEERADIFYNNAARFFRRELSPVDVRAP